MVCFCNAWNVVKKHHLSCLIPLHRCIASAIVTAPFDFSHKYRMRFRRQFRKLLTYNDATFCVSMRLKQILGH